MIIPTGLIDAIAGINKELGKGFAEAHPELIGAYMQAAAIAGLAEQLKDLAQAAHSIAQALENQ